MTEADDPAIWARMMMDRDDLPLGFDQLTDDAGAMTVEERAEWLLIWEKLAFLEAMTSSRHDARSR